MSDKYPYPQAEHYVFPKNPIEMMDEHLRLYFDGEKSRSEIVANSCYYRGTRLYTALKDYAAISQLALTNNANHPHHPSIDRYRMDFHAGSVCALHNNLHCAPHRHKEFILSNDPLHPLHVGDIDRQSNRIFIEDVAAHMIAWYNGGSQDLLDQQDEDFTMRLKLIAASAYYGMDDSLQLERSFIDGYMFACNLVWQYANHRNL